VAEDPGVEVSQQREALRVELEPAQRRVLGTLIEKVFTTPEYYPLTTKALMTGGNQRNNRDPVTNYSEDDVRAALAGLQHLHLVMAIKPEGGHATRWRHELDRRFGIQGRELAVLGELLLRGAQTEGELRARASRMRPFPDLESLHETLQRLRDWTPPLVIRLSPEGALRGVRHVHALMPVQELEELRRQERSGELDAGSSEAPHAAASAVGGDVSQLRMRVAELERRLARIEGFLNKDYGGAFPATEGPSRQEDAPS
jgi:uncharacterized protein YceH (UPF0502 family)